jgi:hypothetical protein
MAGWSVLETRRAAQATVALAAASGCGGAAPLLHPAQVLPLNTISVGAGVNSQIASDSADRRIDRGRAAASESLSDPTVAQAYSAGVLTRALLSPGTAPWVAARAGLPYDSEAGLTYTGRSVRLDGRHAFAVGDALALSVGLGATALLPSADSLPPLPASSDPDPSAGAEFELDAGGWGADIPVLVGYEGIAGFFDVWAGVRGGFETISGKLRSVAADAGAPRYSASGHRWWTGMLVGFSVGVPPLWLRFELSSTFHQLAGEVSAEDGPAEGPFGRLETSGWTLAPAGALVGKF